MRAHEFERGPGLDPYILEIAVLLEGLATHHVLLNEAAMTADQVQSLFAGVEQKMIKAQTMTGKVLGSAGKGLAFGAKGLKTLNDAKDRLLQAAQNTKAVAGFDNLAEKYLGQLKKAIGSKFPKVIEGFEKYADWAKKNPVKQGLIIAALAAAASLIAAPSIAGWGAVLGASSFVGSAGVGAAAGFILRTLNSLLKGEKLSGALFKGAVGGLVGLIAGMGIKELTEMFGDPAVDDFIAVTDTGKKDVILSSFSQKVTLNYTDPETGKDVLKDYFLDVMGTPDELDKLKDTFDGISTAMREGDTDTATALLRSVAKQNFLDYEGEDIPGLIATIKNDSQSDFIDWAGKFIGKELADITSFNNEIEKLQAEFRDKVVALANGIQAAAQGAAAGATKGNKTAAAESHVISEVDLKGAMGKVGSWAAKQGKEVMQQFTQKKLLAAWNNAGKPLESRAIYKMLIQLGIPVDVVKDSFGSQKIPLPTKDDPEAAVAKTVDDKGTNDDRDVTEPTKADPSKFSTGNKSLDDTVREILSTKGKEAALAYLNNLEKGTTAPAASGSSKKVLKASDGNTYNLSVGKSGDRIWLDAKTGSEASPAIDAELEKASGVA